MGAEAVGAAHVDQQHHGQLSLLLKYLDIGMVETGGDIPVDAAYVVAVLVFAHLAKGHATPLEGTVVFAREQLSRQTARLDLYLADFL